MKCRKDVESADRSMVAGIAIVAGGTVVFFMLFAQRVFFPGRVFWFLLPDLLFAALAVWLLWRVIRGAGLVAGTILWPKGTPVVRDYSEQQALIERGLISDAVESFRAYLVAYPDDLDARLRLAGLLSDRGGDVDGAEQCYLDIRSLGPTPQQEWAVANGLIDLYRAAGRRPQLKAELARFARRYSNTVAGKNARSYLQQLTREDGAAQLSE